jgi:hypothetical protein
MPQKKQPGVNLERIRLDLKTEDPLLEAFRYVRKEKGVTLNTELVRILIKEEYDRLKRRQPYLMDDPLVKQTEQLITEHKELGYRDIDDFTRNAIRQALAAIAKNEDKKQLPH